MKEGLSLVLIFNNRQHCAVSIKHRDFIGNQNKRTKNKKGLSLFGGMVCFKDRLSNSQKSMLGLVEIQKSPAVSHFPNSIVAPRCSLPEFSN